MLAPLAVTAQPPFSSRSATFVPQPILEQQPKTPREPAARAVTPHAAQSSPLLEALLRLDCLGRLPRTGWLQAGISNPESIAAHTTGVALVALALAQIETPPIDAERAACLALLHDTPEALLGDLPRDATELLGADAKHGAETRAAERLLPPLGQTAQTLFEEVHARSSRAAKFVGLCDKLQLGIQLVHHRRFGRRGLEEFERGFEALDCEDFAACLALKQEILGALQQVRAGEMGSEA